MHLHIPQMQVFGDTQIGILGTGPHLTEDTIIQFIVVYHDVGNSNPWMDETASDLYEAIDLVVGAQPTISYPSDGPHSSATFLFSSVVKGKLRNSRRFLKAMTGKILKALEKVEKGRRDEETQDHLANS